MRTMRFGVMVGCVALLLTVTVGAQNGLQCALGQGGALTLSLDGEKLGMLELNAHGPEWKYASQATATAETKTAEDGKGRIVTGRLPVPNAEGGAVVFTQTVTPAEKGLAIGYDLSFSQVMTINGLQISLVLPVKPFVGKGLVVRTGEGDQEGTFAETVNREKWQIVTVKGTQVKIATGEPQEITLTSDRVTDIAINDLRRWDREEFEIRFALVAEDKGKQVTAADTYPLKLTLGFAQPVTLKTP